MPFRPLFQVTDFRLTKRSNPASRYAETAEKIDLWKVFLAHGYYAGLGMEFWFPTEGEASRFSLWTIYDQGQIIDTMDNRKFQVWKVAKTQRMGARNRYTGVRSLQDFWRVGFEGENDDFLDIYFPSEHEANGYLFGHSYSMTDLFGTLPAVPQDLSLLLRERAARLQEQATPPGTGVGGGGPGGSDMPPPGENPPPAPPPTPPPPPPPPPIPPTPQQILAGLQANAIWQVWVLSGNGAAGWYARTPSNLTFPAGTRYNQIAVEFRTGWSYYQTGTYGTIGGPYFGAGSNFDVPPVGPNGSYKGFYVNYPLV